jgi:hypothetical protein
MIVLFFDLRFQFVRLTPVFPDVHSTVSQVA